MPCICIFLADDEWRVLFKAYYKYTTFDVLILKTTISKGKSYFRDLFLKHSNRKVIFLFIILLRFLARTSCDDHQENYACSLQDLVEK